MKYHCLTDDGSEIVVVKWNVSTPPTDNTVEDDEHCEVNYQVRWKLASDDHYIPPNTMLIQSGREARIDVSISNSLHVFYYVH